MTSSGEHFKRRPYEMNIREMFLKSIRRSSRRTSKIWQEQQLLPGLPDHLTIKEISSRLSWSVLSKLTCVNHRWLRAIQSHEIFRARNFFKAPTQTAFVFQLDERENLEANESQSLRLALYFPKSKYVYYLPQIPSFTASFVTSFTYTCVKGKLYIILTTSILWKLITRRFMYVFDLIGHIGWRRCADPKLVTRFDDCIVMNDKIFIFCNTFRKHADTSCAMYDPTKDVWTSITATSFVDQQVLAGIHADHSSRCFSLVGGGFGDDEKMEAVKVAIRLGIGIEPQLLFYTSTVPLRDLSRTIESGKATAVMFIQGRILKIAQHGLHVYASHTNTWISLHAEDMKNLIITCRRWCTRTYTSIDILSVRIRGVAVVADMLYALVEMIPRGRQCTMQLWRRKAVIDDSHQDGPFSVKDDLDQWKLYRLAHRRFPSRLLKCPVQL